MDNDERPGCRLSILIASAAAFYLLYLLKAVVAPVLVAFLIAYLLDPVVDRFEARKYRRDRAILILTLAAVFLLVLAALILIPVAVKEATLLSEKFPAYLETLKVRIIPALEERLAGLVPGLSIDRELFAPGGRSLIERVPPDLWQRLFAALVSTVRGTFNAAASLIGVLIIPLYLFYFLKDFDHLKEQGLTLIPPRYREFITLRMREVDEVLGAFIRGQMIVAAILAVFYALGLSLIGLDAAVLLGIFSGAAFIVPYVGTIIALALSSFLAFLQFHDLAHPLYVAALYGTAQAIEGMVLTPKIVGEKVGLHPLAVVIAVIAGGELFGFMGILLAVPAAAALRIFAIPALESYRQSRFYRAP